VSGRDVVFAKVRRALGVTGEEPARKGAVAERLANPQANLIPARGRRDREGRVALFKAMAEKVSASVERLGSAAEVPAAIANHLRNHNLPQQIRSGVDPKIEALDWSRAPQLERFSGASDGRDAVSFSRAFAGVAESGTLMLLSGPDNPTTLNFLPDTHLVVLFADDITHTWKQVIYWGKDRVSSVPGMSASEDPMMLEVERA